MKLSHCPNCNQAVEPADKFCPGCGNSLNENTNQTANTIRSSGNYSGKMTKGKKSKGWKIFRNSIISLILIGIVALIIWFQVDPDAGKKLTDVLMGIAFMAVFFFVGWLFMRGKKGKGNSWDDDQYHNVADDDDED